MAVYLAFFFKPIFTSLQEGLSVHTSNHPSVTLVWKTKENQYVWPEKFQRRNTKCSLKSLSLNHAGECTVGLMDLIMRCNGLYL